MSGGTVTSAWYSGQAAACVEWGTLRTAAQATYEYRNGRWVSAVPASCQYDIYMKSNGSLYVSNSYQSGLATRTVAPAASVYSCSNGGTLSTSSCICSGTNVDTGTSCVSAQQASCTSLAGQTAYVTAPGFLSPGQTVCGQAGCNVTMAQTVINYTNKLTGAGVGEGDATITSTPCTYSSETAGAPAPAASAATTATPSTCPGGSVGQVMGVQICVLYDPNMNTMKSSSTTTSEATANGPAGAASSTSSTSSTTTCEGATCTTSSSKTTTPGDSTGTPTTTTEKTTQTKAEFCVKNPADALCQVAKSSFGGACGTAPACSGDAVMCAVAAATFKSECLTERGTMPDAIPLVNIEKSVVIAKDAGWGPDTGTCPPPRQIVLSFATIPLPLDVLCQFALQIRPFVVGLAYLSAALAFVGLGRKA